MSDGTITRTPDQEKQWAEFARKYGADKPRPQTGAAITPVEEKKQRSLVDILRRRNEDMRKAP